MPLLVLPLLTLTVVESIKLFEASLRLNTKDELPEPVAVTVKLTKAVESLVGTTETLEMAVTVDAA